MDAPAPAVEIAYYANALRVRRPDCKINAARVAYLPQMRAEFFVKLPMLAFAEQMQIDLAQDRPVLVRVSHRVFRAVPICDSQLIIEIAGRVWNLRLKKPVSMK